MQLAFRPTGADLKYAEYQLNDTKTEAADARMKLPALGRAHKWMLFVMQLLAVAVFALVLRNNWQLHEDLAELKSSFEAS